MGKILFNDGWSFTKRTLFAEQADLNGILEESQWEEVDLPHDWLIYHAEDLYETGEGWYRKEFILEDIKEQVLCIRFEGVYMDSVVYVNGRAACEWKYGYSTFEFDITEYVKTGKNQILVRVLHQHPNSRWYSGAGIYRRVWLVTSSPVHLVSDGIYIAVREAAVPEGLNNWYVELETEAVKAKEDETALKTVDAVIRHSIIKPDGTELASGESRHSVAETVTKNIQSILVKAPELWSLSSPCLYTLKTQLIVDGEVIDEEAQYFGFRTLDFDPEEGLFLNHQHIKLRGVNEHHDLGALGAAVNKTALRRKFRLLKEMGVNAIRTAHNMPAAEMMELADELGILIVSEAFDMWERPKNEFDYARFFDDWYQKDIASWVRRDRNRPSLLMWSIGNEIYDTHASTRGIELTRLLREQVLLHDPKQNARAVIGSNYMFSENAISCADELKLAGYNYLERLYDEQHAGHPDWCIFGSETGATVQSRGIYHFPQNRIVVMYEDEQCSSLDNCTTSWGVKSIQDSIVCYRDRSYTLGQFIWTGFDYIGEPTPYTTKNSYYGQLDTAGFPKDSYYLYQAEWTDYKSSPMIHIFPYWDFNKGQLIDILVCSNAPRIELFFQERSLGSFEIDHAQGKQLTAKWQLPYQPGTLRAVAYDENGGIIATDYQSSFSDAVMLVLKPDKTALYADGEDLIFLEISMQDKNNTWVANANNRVEVEVSGAGRLIGLDNGDSTDYDQYKGTSRRLFSGKLLAIIAARTVPGDIRVRVSSNGLPTEEIQLKALPAEVVSGISARTGNAKSEPDREIPIRKIELIRNGSGQLDRENKEAFVEARLLPENNTYQEIEWKAVTLSGIETNIAGIETVGNTAKVTALGDGEFRLRCIARNGGRLAKVISELEFEASGLGRATINPYEPVDAALYNVSNYELDSGLMGGINTRDNERNVVGFQGLDFRDYGSDEVTVSICYWGNDPVPVEIWEGTPGSPEAVKLMDTVYQAEWIWGTFQPNTFRLPKRLKGMTTVCFVFYHKLNLQNICFTYKEKVFEQLMAKDNNRIYGDSFTISEDAIEHIGNNSSIEFDGMNFEEGKAVRLVICGRSHTDNTIHIHFDSEQESISHSVEFPYSEAYVTKEFDIGRINGLQKVSFVFLPGCNFDFQWFRFETV